MTLGAGAKLFSLMPVAVALQIAAMGDASGASAFPETSSGKFCGTTLVPCSGVSATEIVLVDASQIAAASGELMLDASRQATVEMSTTPDSPESATTSPTSFWQMGLVGLKAERYFSATRARSTAVAQITGINVEAGNSP